ncbi:MULTISPECIES: helix-turn-helix transcriptional regulator [Chitinophagaceae]
MDIQKRFDRILGIFLQLQAKPLVTAHYLAEKFEVSLRTIYRDIKSLEKAGVPIYSEAGIGYSLMHSYRLPPTLFTREEALSFSTAEKLMHSFLDKKLASDFSSALLKMKAVLRLPEQQIVEEIDKNVILNRKQKDKYFNISVPDASSILLKSITSHKQVSIQYLKKGNDHIETRQLEPIGLFLNTGYWYFMAYCHLRKDYRQFRLDRIQHIQLTNEDFTLQHRELSYYLKKEEHPTITHPITIKIPKSIASYLSWERDYFGFTKEKEEANDIIMEFACPTTTKGFIRWFTMFGDQATIVSPSSLREELEGFLQGQLNLLKKQ